MANGTINEPLDNRFMSLDKDVTATLKNGEYLIAFVHSSTSSCGLYIYHTSTSWLATIQDATNVTLTVSGTSISWTSSSTPRCAVLRMN